MLDSFGRSDIAWTLVVDAASAVDLLEFLLLLDSNLAGVLGLLSCFPASLESEVTPPAADDMLSFATWAMGAAFALHVPVLYQLFRGAKAEAGLSRESPSFRVADFELPLVSTLVSRCAGVEASGAGGVPGAEASSGAGPVVLDLTFLRGPMGRRS